MLIQAIRPGPTRLGEVTAMAIIVDLALCIAGHVEEPDAEAERDCYACVGRDVAPIDGCAFIAAPSLEGLEINSCGGPQEHRKH